MNHDPILHLLGLAKKAGKLEIGEEPVGAVCRSRHARVLLLASDAAPNTCRRAAHFGEAGNVLWLQLPHTKDELGWQLGRKSCAMVAVTDFGIAAAIGEKLALLDPRYVPASEQLRTKAERALQRQREKRRHERNVQMGKRKPWAPPAAPETAAAPQRQGGSGMKKDMPKPARGASEPKPFRPERPDRNAPARSGPKRPTDTAGKDAARPLSHKPGPGGKKLTARTVPGRRPYGRKP